MTCEALGFLDLDQPPLTACTDEERAVDTLAKAFTAREVAPHDERLDSGDDGLVKELIRQAGDQGLTTLDAMTDGNSLLSALWATEASGPFGSWAVSLGTHTGIGTLPLAWFGTAEQQQRWLASVRQGTTVAAFALTEPGSGSDAASLTTRATPRADGRWELNGQKLYVSNGGLAGLYTVFAKTDGARIGAFLVPRETPGLGVGKKEEKLGLRGSSTTALYFDGVVLPPEALVGQRGMGLRIAMNALFAQRLKVAAAALGAMKGLLARSVVQAKTRVQFGRSIGNFPLVGAKLASMAGLVVSLDAALRVTARALESATGSWPQRFESFSVEASCLKVFSSEALNAVADETVQVFGGAGFMSPSPIERGYRDQRVQRIFEGTNEIHRASIAAQALKRVRAGSLLLAEPVHGRLEAAAFTRQVAHDALRALELEEEVDQEALGAASDLLIDALVANALNAASFEPGWTRLAVGWAQCAVAERAFHHRRLLSACLGREVEGPELDVDLGRRGARDQLCAALLE
jgi:alkylation response protein AidB-like acyl-CoA dehydrogenase